jgi:XTP/dITP diphosphohydrolase
MQILIGTQNRAKQQDFTRSIAHESELLNLDIELTFPQDFNIRDDVEETGETFSENSLIKAKFYFEKTRIPVIADDGGIIIPILGNNIPGVHSKRWVSENPTDQEVISFTLKKLEPYPDEADRKTLFQTCLTFYDGNKIIQTTGETIGHIGLKALDMVTEGFPYRSLFILPNGKYYDALTPGEHEQYNHRDQAVRKLLAEFVNSC